PRCRSGPASRPDPGPPAPRLRRRSRALPAEGAAGPVETGAGNTGVLSVGADTMPTAEGDRRVRRYCPRPRASAQIRPRATSPTHPRPTHGPIRTAGVTTSYRPTRASAYDMVRGAVEVTTDPSGAITPVRPLIAATTT